MKKNYLIPEMCVVLLQHQGLLMQNQSVQGFSSNLTDENAIGYGGSSEGYSGDIRTKGQNSIWDEEW